MTVNSTSPTSNCGLSDKPIDVCYATQGLYEYVRPSWEQRPRPKVDGFDMKSFGSTTPHRPTAADGASTALQTGATVLPA